MLIRLEGITMKNQSYFDTFPQTIATSCERFVPAKVLVGLWNTPVIAIVLLWNLLLVWQQRVDTRRQLGDLDRRLLRDMGIGHMDAGQESTKPFWRG